MPTDPRVSITFLAAPSGRDAVDDLAAAAKTSRSETLRAMLRVAFAHKKEVIDLLVKERL